MPNKDMQDQVSNWMPTRVITDENAFRFGEYEVQSKLAQLMLRPLASVEQTWRVSPALRAPRSPS